MPLSAIRTVAASQNGVGAYVLPCKTLDFLYCAHWGSSKGMLSYLQHSLSDFAKANPGVEIRVARRPNKHPVVRAQYVNGREKAICVRNLEKDEIMQKVLLLRNASGQKLKRETKPVKSLNESVRGIWDPYHAPAWKI